MYMGKALDPSIYTRARSDRENTNAHTARDDRAHMQSEAEIRRTCTAKRQSVGEAQGPREKPARGNKTRQKGERGRERG